MKRLYTIMAVLFTAALVVLIGVCCSGNNEESHEGHDHEAESAAAVATETDEHGAESAHDQTAEPTATVATETDEHGADCDGDHGSDAMAAFLGTESGADDDGHDQEREHGENTCVTLGEGGAANLGITTTVIQPEIYYDQIKIPGTLAADPDRQVEISAPAIVRVISLSATPPATVKPGERLAVLELADSEVRGLQMEAVDTRAELMAAEIELERQERYLESLQSGTAQPTEVQRVSADVRIASARVQARRSALAAQLASLRVAGLSEAQLRQLEADGTVATQIEVLAPSLPASPSLEVANRPISLGETIDAGETLFSLVALDELRVIGEAFEADMPLVRNALRERLPISLLFPAADCMVKDLTIEAIEGALDGVNRVTHFFLRLSNPILSERQEGRHRYQERRHSAGSRVQIMVATQERGERFVIPSSALVTDAGEVYAFVKEADGYDRIAIQVESIDGRLAIVPHNGHLYPGDAVVVQGALQLNLLWHEQYSGGTTAIDPHAGHNH